MILSVLLNSIKANTQIQLEHYLTKQVFEQSLAGYLRNAMRNDINNDWLNRFMVLTIGIDNGVLVLGGYC